MSIIPNVNVEAFRRRDNLFAVIGFAAIIGAALGLNTDSLFPGIPALAPVLGAVLLIVSPNSAVNRFLLSNRPMVGIGLISYPLYLWHWPLLSYLGIVRHGVPTLIEIWLALIVAFILAWLTYRFVEMPLRRRPDVVPRLSFGLIAVGVAGIVTTAAGGFGFRFPQEIRDIALFPSQSNVGLLDQCFLEKPGGPIQFKLRRTGRQSAVAAVGRFHRGRAVAWFEKGPTVRTVSPGALRGTGLRADPGGRIELQMRCGQ